MVINILGQVCYSLLQTVPHSQGSKVLSSESRWKKQQPEDRIALSDEVEAASHSTGGIPYLVARATGARSCTVGSGLSMGRGMMVGLGGSSLRIVWGIF